MQLSESNPGGESSVGGGGGVAGEESTIALGRGDETSVKRLSSIGIGNGSLSGNPVEAAVGMGVFSTIPLPVNFGLACGTGAIEVPVGRLLLSLVPFPCERYLSNNETLNDICFNGIAERKASRDDKGR